jgi:hypothetical protein
MRCSRLLTMRACEPSLGMKAHVISYLPFVSVFSALTSDGALARCRAVELVRHGLA